MSKLLHQHRQWLVASGQWSASDQWSVVSGQLRRLIGSVLLGLIVLEALIGDGRLLSTIHLSLTTPAAEAAEGIYKAIPYQGKVSLTSGTAVGDGTYNMRFKIFDVATAGTALWTETWNESTQRVTMTGGLFTVYLGQHTAITGVDFNTDSIYLQVEFDPGNDGTYEETFSPRRRFASVPYAMNSDTVDGLHGSQFIRADADDTATGSYIFSNTGISIAARGTLSGAIIHASSQLRSSGSLMVGGSVRFKNYASCSIVTTDSAGNLGCSTGAVMTQASGDARYVNTAGDTMTGGLLINLNGSASASIDSGLALEWVGTASGRRLHIQDGITNSGSLVVEGASTLNGTLTVGGATSLNSTLIVTGLSTFSANIAGTNAQFSGSVSGHTLRAVTTLASSGVLVVEGVSKLHGTLSGNTIEGFNLTTCNTSTQKILWNSTTKAFECGTDLNTGSTYAAGQGLSLNGTVFSLSNSFSGTALEIMGTASGRIIHAQDLLRSSGALIVEGVTTLNGAVSINSTLVVTGLSTFSANIAGTNAQFSGSVSGHTLRATTTLASSGVLVVEGASKLHGTLSGNTIEGFNLITCSSSDSKITWNSTTKTFGCGTDLDTSGASTGSLITHFDRRFVQVQGDTMTGGLLIHSTNNTTKTVDAGILLEIAGTASGSHLHAQMLLTSSGKVLFESNIKYATGALVVDVNASGTGVYVDSEATNAPLLVLDSFTQDKTGAPIGSPHIMFGYKGFIDVKLYRWSGSTLGVNASLLPETDATYNLGSSKNRWRDLFVSSGSLHIGNSTNEADISYDSVASDALSFNIQGGTAEVVILSSGNMGIGTTAPSEKLEVVGTISGRILHAQDLLRSSGTLIVDGATTLNAAVSINSTLVVTGLSTFSANIAGTNAQFSGTVSGHTLRAVTTLASSGVLVVEGASKLHGTLSGNTIEGFNLSTCSAAGDKLLWNSATKAFTCGTDGGSAYTAGQGLTLAGSVFSLSNSFSGTALEIIGTASGRILHAQDLLRSSGTLIVEGASTLNGALTVGGATSLNSTLIVTGLSTFSATISGTNAYFSGTVSGHTLRATTTLASSGVLVVEGASKLHGTLSGNTIEGFNLTTCSNATTSKLLWNSTSKTFSCGTDTDTTYAAGQGLTLASSVFSLSSSFSGTALEIMGTASGRRIHAQDLLTSSGGLVIEGASRLNGNVTVAGHILPVTTNTYDLGSSSLRWRDLYLSGSSIHMGTSGDEGILRFDTTSDSFTLDPNGNGTADFRISDIGTIDIAEVDGDAPAVVGYTRLFARGSAAVAGNDSGTTFLSHMESSTNLIDNIASAGTNTSAFQGSCRSNFSSSVFKFGTKSLYLNCSSFQAYRPSSNSFTDDYYPSGDFTVDMWAYEDAHTSNLRVLAGMVKSNDYQWLIYLNSSNKLEAAIKRSNNTVLTLTSTAAFTATQWTHVALERSGTTFRLYQDGVVAATATSESSNLKTLSATRYLMFGNRYPTTISGDANFTGNLDEVRFSKVARYSGAFTPATAAYESSASSNLLVRLSDGTLTNLTETVIGTSDSAWTVNEDNSIYYLFNNVGIGTDAPKTALEVVGTISGSTIHAEDMLTSSGGLTVKKLAGTSTGNILIVDSKGLIYDASNKRVGIGTITPDSALEVIGTVSGRILHAQDLLRSSGALIVEGATTLNSAVSINSTLVVTGLSTFSATISGTNAYFSGTVSGHTLRATTTLASSGVLVVEGASKLHGTLSGNTIEGFNLTTCSNATTSKLLWNSTSKTFSCGTDTDTTYAAGQGLTLASSVFSLSSSFSGTAIEIMGTASGRILHAQDLLRSSGTLIVEGASTLNGALTVGGATSLNSTLIVTGLSTFSANIVGTNAQFSGSVSGHTLRATTTLASSGVLVVEGASKLHGTLSGNTIEGFNLTTCSNATTSKLLWNSTSKTFSCGTDTDTTYAAGQGLTLSSTTFSLSNSFSGTALEIMGTASGRIIHAQDQLRSSGSLIVDGSTFVLGHSTFANCSALETVSGVVTCGTDDTGAGGSAFTSTGSLQTYFDNRFVRVSGDTMTGGLLIHSTNDATKTIDAGLLLEIAGTASGRHLHAQALLTSSGKVLFESNVQYATGALVIDVNASGTGVYVDSEATNAPLLVLDSATESKTGTPIGAPHIMFGYKGFIDVKLYRWSGSTLGVNASLLPETDARYDLGSSKNRWRDLFVSSGSLHIGNSTNEADISYDSVATDALSFNIQGGTAEMVVLSTGNVGIGTTAPKTKLEVIGTISGSLITQNGGGNNYFLGNLGVGTTAPSQKFEVSGSGTITGRVTSTVATYGRAIQGFLVGAKLWDLGQNTDATNLGSFVIREDSTARLTILAGGNVGIGTTNPLQPLTINNATPIIGFSVSDVEKAQIKGNADSAGGKLTFSTLVSGGAMTEKMRIDNAGNVGIGKTPTTKLEVVGTISGSLITQNGAGTNTFAGATTFSNTVTNQKDGGNALSYLDSYNSTDASTTALTILRRARGSLASPTAVLAGDWLGALGATGHNGTSMLTANRSIVGFLTAENWNATRNGTNMVFYNTPTGSTTATERMRLTSTGSLGLGTTTPSEKLEVKNGNLRLSSGSILATPISPTVAGSITDATNFDQAIGVAVQGRYAYMTSSVADTLSIIDIAVPTAPVRIATIGGVGNTDLDNAFDVAVNGNYAYVTAPNVDKLTVIDISNPTSPSVVGSVSSSTQLDGANAIAIAGKYAYVTALADDRITAVDISDPTAPAIVGSSAVDSTDTNYPYDIKIQGKYAYVAVRLDSGELATGARLTIFDISNPANITKVSTVANAALNDARTVYVSGRYAYVTGYASDSVVIVDISNPASPSVVGSITHATRLNLPSDVIVAGKYAYVTGTSYVTVLDVSNPASPAIVGYTSDATNLNTSIRMAMAGRYLYVAAAGTDRFTVMDTGNELPSLYAGALGASILNVEDTATVGQDARIGGSLNVGGLTLLNNDLQVKDTLYVKTASGYVGINTTAPKTALEVLGTISGSLITTSGIGTNYLMGNVAVGTATPNIHGYANAGGLLTLQNAAGTSLHGVLELANRTDADEQPIGDLAFTASSQTSAVSKRSALIRASLAGATANNRGSALLFYTRANGGTNDIAERMRIDENGNVGIGTASPKTALDVLGTISGSVIRSGGNVHAGDKVISSRYGFAGIYNSTQVQGIWAIGDAYEIDTAANDFGNLYGLGYAYSTNGGAPFVSQHQVTFVSNGTVNAAVGLNGAAYFAGNVGIGKTVASTKLDVRGTISGSLITQNGPGDNYFMGELGIGTTAPAVQLHVSSSTDDAELRLESLVGGPSKRTTISGGSGGELRFDIDTGLNGSSRALIVNFGTTERMRMDSSGNLGIGTAAPTSLLDVSSATAGIITLSRNDTTVTANDSAGTLQFYANDASSTTNKIVANIEAQATNTVATNINPGRLIFRTTSTTVAATPTERMRITEAGLVGIGTTAPTERFTASGNILIDTDATTAATNVFKIITNVTSVNNTVFRISGSGAVYADGVYNSAGADYAEWFYSRDTLLSGEVVCIDPARNNAVERCTNAADGNLMGIVSTNPAFVGNSIGGADGIIPPGYALIGLIGQVPAFVSDEGGAIRPGDALTSGSKPGTARRAQPGESTVGVALEGLSAGEGVINVLISRRNSSLTVDTVEEKVLQTVAAMEIEDEVQIMISEAMATFDLDQEVTNRVRIQVEELDLAGQIDRALAGLDDADAAEPWNDMLLRGSGLTIEASLRATEAVLFEKELSVLGPVTVAQTLKAASILTNGLTVSGSVLISQDLEVRGAIRTESLQTAGDIVAGGTLHAGAIEASGAILRGSVSIEGTLMVNGVPLDEIRAGTGYAMMGSGGTMDMNALFVRESLFVLGDITIQGLATFLGDVDVKGELKVSSRQAGYTLIPQTGTSVTVHFDPPFAATPVVTASSDSFAAWRIRNQSQTGFTLEIQSAAIEPILFSWHALATDAPVITEGTGALTLQLVAFPVDALGYPVSSNDVWNACIRNQTVLDSEGKPYSCSRYHTENVWIHPDSGIEFNWDSERNPQLILPEGFEVVVTEDSEETDATQDAEETEETEIVDAEYPVTGSGESVTGSGTNTETQTVADEEAPSPEPPASDAAPEAEPMTEETVLDSAPESPEDSVTSEEEKIGDGA